MFGDTDLPTRVEDWARGTLRQSRGADMFAEWNKQAVDLNPKPFRQFGLQMQHSLFRRLCGNKSPSIRHPMDMNIHTDRRFPARDTQHEMSAFWTHSCE
jgi:hypothetical protein